jgi:Spa2 homology domain (SHD) of GIT
MDPESHPELTALALTEPANSRSSARQKLTRLTRQQFQELSTDVYDELMRRTYHSSDNEGLPTLIKSRFPNLIHISTFFACPRRLPPKAQSSSSKASYITNISI